MADSTARFSNWFQIISNVAIIFGLGLVVYELNQSKQLGSGQFISDNMVRETSIRLAMMGEDPREALAKASLHPADLNERDVVALDAYYESIVLGWFNVMDSSQRAGIDSNLKEIVAFAVQNEFSTEPARRWLRAWVAGMDDNITFGTEIYEIVEKAVQDDSSNFPRSQYELLLANE
jgi:hypothetical protein